MSERAGLAAQLAGRPHAARDRLQRAIDGFRSADLARNAARASAELGEVLWIGFGEIHEAVRLMDASLADLGVDDPDERIAFLMHQAARLHFFSGDLDLAMRWADRCLDIAEAQGFPAVISHSLNTRSLILRSRGRLEEARALLRHALVVAEAHGLTREIMRALFNMADQALAWDRDEEALALDTRLMQLARRLGDRATERMTQMHLVGDYYALGRWDEAMSLAASLPSPEESAEEGVLLDHLRATTVPILVERGSLEDAEEMFQLVERYREGDVQDVLLLNWLDALILRARGLLAEALSAAERSVATVGSLGLPSIILSLEVALKCAFDLGRPDRVEELLRLLEEGRPTDVPPGGRAVASRFRARLAAAAGDVETAEEHFHTAVRICREIAEPFRLAKVLLEEAEVIAAAGRPDDAAPLLAESRAIFERLGAGPWIERVDAATQPKTAAADVAPA